MRFMRFGWEMAITESGSDEHEERDAALELWEFRVPDLAFTRSNSKIMFPARARQSRAAKQFI